MKKLFNILLLAFFISACKKENYNPVVPYYSVRIVAGGVASNNLSGAVTVSYQGNVMFVKGISQAGRWSKDLDTNISIPHGSVISGIVSTSSGEVQYRILVNGNELVFERGLSVNNQFTY